jgi:hypothetical protein
MTKRYNQQNCPTKRAQMLGILRDLQAFFWLRVFPAPKQSPRPPTYPLAQTVRRFYELVSWSSKE